MKLHCTVARVKNQGACLGIVKENLLKDTAFGWSLKNLRLNIFFWVFALPDGRGKQGTSTCKGRWQERCSRDQRMGGGWRGDGGIRYCWDECAPASSLQSTSKITPCIWMFQF